MKLINGLIKWIIVLAAGLSAVLLSIIFLSNNPDINSFVLRLIILAAAGFLGGLVGRILFSKVPSFMLVLIVMVANVLAVMAIDLFYDTPYQFGFFTSEFRFQAPSISDGGQTFFLTLVSLFPLLIMRRSRKATQAQAAPKPRKKRKTFSESLKPVLYQINPQNWQVFKPKSKVKRKKSSSSASRSRSAAAPTLTISRPAKTTAKIKSGNGRKPAPAKKAVKKLKMPAKLFGGYSNDVKLVGDEEHVCPYCLEEVTRGDKVGVAVCPECGTWHHQDCWSLTGSCGVAHRNEL